MPRYEWVESGRTGHRFRPFALSGGGRNRESSLVMPYRKNLAQQRAQRKRGPTMSMDRQEAIEFLVDHYQNPRNRGQLADADVHLTGGNPGCADRVEMYAKVSPDGHVEEVTFEGEGCTISMAAASYVTEMVKGMTLDEVEN